MEIIPRSQSGLAPPRGSVPSGIKKKYIIIHYTDSSNGILSPDQERSLMRMWQTMHENQYGAVDILQGFSVFWSGRIYENRIPWDSNNGAIYNAGGGQYDGVGIECQGDFHGSVFMDDTQYQALLFLCVELVKRLNIPLDGPVVLGHQQIYPCRPGDAKSTDCPANLLPQLLLSGRLKNDIIARVHGVQPQPEEEEMGMMFIPPQKMPKQGDLFVWEFVEGFNQLALYTESHVWLNLYNESSADVEVKWFTSPSIGEQTVKVGGYQRKSVAVGDITKAKGIKDGFTTVVKCKSESLASGISIFAK